MTGLTKAYVDAVKIISPSNGDENESNPVFPRCYLCKRTQGEITFFRLGKEEGLKTTGLNVQEIGFNAPGVEYIYHLCVECLCLLQSFTKGEVARAQKFSQN